ncbi:MAG: aldo/keto reductase [Defluviitaleaceae bacterium]|nr:aldo/keto reductase [Defluviitaleaceae bacterium]
MIPKTPILGFGAMRLPTFPKDGEKNQWNNSGPIDVEQVKLMFDWYLDAGFNYFDTGYAYHGGKSEEVVGEALVKRHRRDKFTVATKLPLWEIRNDASARNIFATQMKRTGAEYFDFYLLHGVTAEFGGMMEKFGIYDHMKALKKEGKVRHIGMSFHDTGPVLDKILTDHPEMEFVQLQINCFDMMLGHARDWYEAARRHNVPIIVMEPVRGGTLARLPESALAVLREAAPGASPASWALRYAASLPGVVTTLSGMSALEQVRDNCRTFTDFKPLTAEEEKILALALEKQGLESDVPCTGCNYCISACPGGIEIPVAFSTYNEFMRTRNSWNLGLTYRAIPEGRRAGDCAACGACLERCPQKIDIPGELRKVAEAMEK